MILAEGIDKSYGALEALRDVTFSVSSGEICAILGPNGAGKSTCLKVLSGILSPDRGRVVLGGFDLARQPLQAKAKLGFVPESPELYEAVSVHEFLAIMAALHHVPPSAAEEATRDLIARFQLDDTEDRTLGACSKGTKQKVAIAGALISSPSILILDEPMEGLDPPTVVIVSEIIQAKAHRGDAILFSSHNLDLIESMATTFVFLRRGQVEEASAIIGTDPKGDMARLRELFRASRS